MIKFDLNTWLSFAQELSPLEIQYIESKVCFLLDVVNREINFMDVESDESLESDLDLDFGIYMDYPASSENDEKISSWMIHDGWLNYHLDGTGLNHEIKLKIKDVYENESRKIRENIINLRDFLLLFDRIKIECDAVIWLSFLDFMVTMILFKIQKNRIEKIIDNEV